MKEKEVLMSSSNSGTTKSKLYFGYLVAAVFAFLSLAGSVVILAFIFIAFNDRVACHSPNEEGDSTNLGAVVGLIAVPLCIIGGLTDLGHKRTPKTRHHVSKMRLKLQS